MSIVERIGDFVRGHSAGEEPVAPTVSKYCKGAGLTHVDMLVILGTIKYYARSPLGVPDIQQELNTYTPGDIGRIDLIVKGVLEERARMVKAAGHETFAS